MMKNEYKGLVKGLMSVFMKDAGTESAEEGITARDLRENFPSLYKEYVHGNQDQPVESFLKDKNMLDSVMMIMEQEEDKMEDDKENGLE